MSEVRDSPVTLTTMVVQTVLLIVVVVALFQFIAELSCAQSLRSGAP